jgi:hypothetical protein
MSNQQGDGTFVATKYADDPVGYCRDILQYEPDKWQCDALNSLLKGNVAVSSGHGIGKSRLGASAIHWVLSTRPHPQIVATSNTGVQLSTKLWRELSKVNDNALNKDWFEHTATKFMLKSSPDTWFATACEWNERRPESFAGTHEDFVLYVFDEASAIPDVIWDTSEGAMTTGWARWLVLGNPTRNTGKFADCFTKNRHRWICMQVDSRDAKMTNKEKIAEWVSDYGEDSDFVRVRVRGVFPRSGSRQLISQEDIDECMRHVAIADESQPLVFGVDLARSGECQSVVAIRQGRRVPRLIKWRSDDTTFTVGKITELYGEYNPEIMFVDGGGLGAVVIDRLRQLLPREKVFSVISGASANKPDLYFNKRSEMYGNLRDAMKERIELPDDKELMNDLGIIEYDFDKHNRIKLDSKDDMPYSPDCSDALAMTYAEPVYRKEVVRKAARPAYGKVGWMG